MPALRVIVVSSILLLGFLGNRFGRVFSFLWVFASLLLRFFGIAITKSYDFSIVTSNVIQMTFVGVLRVLDARLRTTRLGWSSGGSGLYR